MRKEYWINVKNADNRLVIYLNGETVWDSGITRQDKEINAFINITEALVSHINHTSELIFEGYNDTYVADVNGNEENPWHFRYRVFARVVEATGNVVAESDMILPFDEKHTSNPNVQAINNCYHITRKDGEFKVVSNSLSQNFTT